MSENNIFGTGSFVGRIMHDPNQRFFDLPARDQARIVGWAAGCPVVEKLIDPNNQQIGRGPETMLGRYAEVDFLFTLITQFVAEVNQPLFEELMLPTQVLPHEPVGYYEQGSVPVDYQTHIAPMGQLTGYAAPRIVSLIINAAPDKETAQDHFSQSIDVIQEVAKESADPIVFLANLCEQLVAKDLIDEKAILRSTLSKDWMCEYNVAATVAEYKRALQHDAPMLWATYNGLDENQKQMLSLA